MTDTKKDEPIVLTPELRAQLAPEIKALEDAAHAKGKTEGAVAERERIKAVEAQLMPGHEKLIEGLKFDGKTTGPEAAVAVLAAEKQKKASKLTELRADAPGAVENLDPTEAQKAAEAAKKKPDANALAKEAAAYHAEQHKIGNKISMIEATEFVYKRAGVPTK